MIKRWEEVPIGGFQNWKKKKNKVCFLQAGGAPQLLNSTNTNKRGGETAYMGSEMEWNLDLQWVVTINVRESMWKSRRKE